MTELPAVIDAVMAERAASGKPLAIILAGHNGSGKSTLWKLHLAPRFQIPLINADRFFMSVLPEPDTQGFIPDWAAELRDTNTSWMRVAQLGVVSFTGHAMASKAAFAMETVFSDWRPQPSGAIASKIAVIEKMQAEGYFVLLCFVGLANAKLSITRVATRVSIGGHDIPAAKLLDRFPRTQKAVGMAASVADSTIMFDNSFTQDRAFTVCRVQLRDDVRYDARSAAPRFPAAIRSWMEAVCPLT